MATRSTRSNPNLYSDSTTSNARVRRQEKKNRQATRRLETEDNERNTPAATPRPRGSVTSLWGAALARRRWKSVADGGKNGGARRRVDCWVQCGTNNNWDQFGGQRPPRRPRQRG